MAQNLTDQDYALAKYNRQMAEARMGMRDFPWTSKLQICFAAAEAKENGLDLTNPFDPVYESELFALWSDKYAMGYAALIPAAQVTQMKG